MELKWPVLFFVGLIPAIVTFVRGAFVGFDSYAYFSSICVNSVYGSELSSDLVSYLLLFIPCNFFIVLWILAFFCLLIVVSWAIIGENLFGKDGWWLGVYVFGLSPALFLMVFNFECALFGYAVSCFGFMLFWIGLNDKKGTRNKTLMILGWIVLVFSIFLWEATVLMLLVSFIIIVLRVKNKYVRNFLLITPILPVIILYYKYALSSFTQLMKGYIVVEEAPIIGLFFVAHLLKPLIKTTDEIKIPTIFLLIIGLIKIKYIFLCVPFLIIILLKNPQPIKLILIESNKYKKISIALLLLFASIMFFAQPTITDLTLIQESIQISKDNNTTLINDWDYGWWITYQGHQTEFRRSYPNPDYNNTPSPFYTLSKQELPCEIIKSSGEIKLYHCTN